jgi:hypothetical protein
MPSAPPDDNDGQGSARPGVWQRMTLAISGAMMRPAAGGDDSETSAPAEGPTTIPEIEEAIRRADDKERLVGLLAAPIAAAIGLIVTSAQIAHDPAATLANGQLNRLHTNPSTYVEFGLIAMALALGMLGAAWFRKRLIMGITAALYGLSIFNLHWWGFGLPFIMIGAWYLVRAYRLQNKLKMAKASDEPDYRSPLSPPPPNKRYTPPSAPATRRSPKPKPGKGLEPG